MLRYLMVLPILTATLALTPIQNISAQETVTIGVGAPLSGQFAPLGKAMRTGVAAAIEAINADGGINGRQLTLVEADDACDGNRASAAANQLVGAGAALVVGHLCYTPTREAAAIYSANGIVQITPGSQTANLTKKRPAKGFFRLAPRDVDQGYTIARFLAERFPDGNIAILFDGTAYGKALADTVKARLNVEGIQEISFGEYASGQQSYNGLVGRLQDNGADAVFIGGYHEDIALIARDMRDSGSETALVVADAVANAEFQAIAGAAANGVFMSVPVNPADAETAAPVLAALNMRPTVAAGYLIASYAAVEVWAKAASDSGSFDAETVAAALQKQSTDTVMGTVTFNESGDWKGWNFQMTVWSNAGYAPLI